MAMMEADDVANNGTDDDEFLDRTLLPVSDEEELKGGGEGLGDSGDDDDGDDDDDDSIA